MMTRCMIFTALAFALTPAHASRDWTTDMIAKLPKELVEQIKRNCAKIYPTIYAAQVTCENLEFDSVQTLIDRGVIKATDKE